MQRPLMLIPMVVACAFFIENFDSTVIATALPAMAQSLGTTAIALSSGLTAYMVTVAIFIPISGWLCDRFGARTVFISAIGLFTLASLACGLSGSQLQFTLARIAQGVGGAMMVPVGRLIVLRTVEKRDFVRAMAFVTVPSVFGQVLGPPLGGLLTTFTSWRWIFFVNIPIGLAGMFLVGRFIPVLRDGAPEPFDWVGFAVIGSAIGTLMIGLDAIASSANAVDVALLLAIGAALAWAGLRHARGRSDSVLDLTLLRVPTFALVMASGFGFRLAFGAFAYLLPLQMQLAFGMSAFESGTLTFFVAVGVLLMKTIAPRILRVWGFRHVLIAVHVFSALGIFGVACISSMTSFILVAALLFFTGLFRSLGYTAINTLAYADIVPPRTSRASSFAGTVDRMSVGVGVACGAILLQLFAPGNASPGTNAFHAVFAVVAALMLLSTVPCVRLGADAGSEVSGRAAAAAEGNRS